VSPVKYELDFHIPERGILHSHQSENLKSYIRKPNQQRDIISANWQFFPPTNREMAACDVRENTGDGKWRRQLGTVLVHVGAGHNMTFCAARREHVFSMDMK
jgi:hypothetical protein